MRIFDPATRTWSTPADTMHLPRWYPTNTTMPSGNVMTFSGSRFYKTLTFGGSTSLANAAASVDDVRPGHITYPNLIWEAPLAESGPWPSAREGHSAVFLKAIRRMVVFGGRNTAGNYLDDTWVLRHEQANTEPYSYDWQEFFGGPGPRYGHVGVGGWSDNSMVAYGGKDGAGTVRGTVHRFGPNAFGALEWTQLFPTGPSPGDHWGHAATWDDDHQRMIVFGGRKSPTELADNKLYVLTVNGGAAAWQEIAPTGTGPTFFREGHSLICDTQGYFRPGKTGGWNRVIIFGGQDAGGAKKNDTWIVWYPEGNPTAMEWEPGPAAPAGLSARTRHAAFWDFPRQRMVVIGGDTGGAGSDDEVWELATTPPGSPTLTWIQAPDHIPGLAGQTVLWASLDVATQPERFDPATGQYTDTFSPRLQEPYYPQMFVLPSGNLLYATNGYFTQMLNTTSGNWSILPATVNNSFSGGTSAMYRPGKVLKASTRATAKLELDPVSDATVGWLGEHGGETMGTDRTDHNLTILPNGKVIVTGGSNAGNNSPEIWDPSADSTNWWSGYGILAANQAVRGYHSTAVLLPDGRILTAGGNADPTTNDQRVTIFCPPYLFDAQGNLAPRPGILEAPCSVAYGASGTFEVRTSDVVGMQLGTVALIRAGAVTHAFDENQRYVPLTFTMCGDRLRVQAPADPNLAPPGDYLLFLVNGSGVPSVARWLRVGGSPLADCDAVIPSQAAGPVADLTSDSEVWLYWNPSADDAPSSGTVTDYEVRHAGQTISDEAAYCNATVADGQAYPPPPSPLAPPGGYQTWQVQWLQPNTTYHFALKARDESWNWGPVSASVSATTLPPGGGGGGFGAGRVAGDAMLQSRGNGDGGTAGVEQAAAEANAPQSSFSEPLSLVARTDEPLAVEMRLEAGGPVWTIHHLDGEAATDLAGSDGASIIFQVPNTDGGWQTLSRLTPAAGSSRFGLRSAGRSRRYVFLGQVGLEYAAQAVEAAGGVVWKLAEARHSQLGDVTPAVRAADGYDLGLASGETLTLTYEQGGAEVESVTDCFILVSPNGTSTGLVNRRRIGRGEQAKTPTTFALHQNQPNPFARITTIRFDLAAESDVRLAVFDAQGRRVRLLASGRRPAGFHMLEWNRRDEAGREVDAGVYLYRLEAGSFRAQRKIVLLP